MMNHRQGIITAMLLMATFSPMLTLPAHAAYFHRHPYQRDALIGGSIGGVAGAALSHRGDRASGAVKGAAVGAGAGVGYVFLKRHL